jgi:hypothetical protein
MARMMARNRLTLLETADCDDQKGCRAEKYRAGPDGVFPRFADA